MEITLINLQKKLPLPRSRIKKLIRKIINAEGLQGAGQISICFSDDALIKKINLKFLKTNSPTDVLAFNFDNSKGKAILADIMISTESAIKHAAIFKTKPEYELLLYVAHGVLHILGYNDQTKVQSQLMRQKEKKYVN